MYDIIHPVTKKLCKKPRSGWRYPTEARFWEEYRAGRIVFGSDENTVPRVRLDLFSSAIQVLPSVQYSYAQTAAQQFDSIFGGTRVFDNPKPYTDLVQIIEYLSGPEDLVIDFFAGSGSLAHAVTISNNRSGGSRKYILIQLPEIITNTSETGRNALSLGLSSVVEITKERVRRVIKKLNNEDQGKLDLEGASEEDRGFRVFKLAESNFKPWNANIPHDKAVLQEKLFQHIDHILEGRSEDDLLFEVLLKSGYELTTIVETSTLAGKKVYSVANGAFLICLERELSLDLIRAMADRQPERIVVLDEGFAGNDQLKTNAVQIFKSKAITSFKTV